MQNETRAGLEIQTINNGYIVTGIKTNGYQTVDTGKIFFSEFKDLSENLTGILRQTFDLAFEEQDMNFFSAWPDNTAN